MEMLTETYGSDGPQKIRTWFYNHYSRPHRQLLKFTRRWSARNAFYHENKEEITKLAQRMSGGNPGSQAFLGALQDATTSLWKKLSIEEQEQYAEIAKEWSEDRPPRDIQAKMAQAAYHRDFQTQLFKTCGMRSVVLVAYANKDGNPRAAMDDWNSVLDDGMSFSKFCPNWKDARVWLEWMKYCRKCFVPEGDQSSPTGRPKTIKKKLKIITDTDREPEIPSITLEDGYSAKIEEECFPLGFPWVDPSKLHLVQIFQLLDHWRQRQKEGLITLIWNPSYQPAQRVHNLQQTNRRRSTFDEPVSDHSSEGEDFADKLRGLRSPSVTPPLPPSPSPSPLRRNEETEQTSTPDTGESSRLPLSNISRPDTFQTLPQRLRGTPIEPTPYNNSDVPELKQGRLKRVVRVTHKARNADTGRGSGGMDPTYLERDH
ncbi:hypothetical protein EDB84DRAFT_1437970 [Lactarius hengduanensis]|nr:hypothetical protein EDB84DRAFT_1437970 [Lactarius hengduanensis]